jgi:hypothetical protein
VAGVNIFLRKRVHRGARIVLIACVEAVLVLEHWAVFNDTGHCSTRRHRAREYAFVPAVEEVTVQSVTGRVTIREDEAATARLVDRARAEPNLIEEGDEMVWVRGRTETVVDAVRVGHVGLVIRRVDVHTIPAGREKDLSSEAVWAVGVAESWSLRHWSYIAVDAVVTSSQ